MDMLKTKLQLFKDLAYEHHSTLESVSNVKNDCQKFIEHMERQIIMRSNEKLGFRTRIGTIVRESVLEMFDSLVATVQQVYCMTEEVHSQLVERQLSLEEVIKHGDPLVREIQSLSNFINQTNLKYASAKSSIKYESESRFQHCKLRDLVQAESPQPNKENIRSENVRSENSTSQQSKRQSGEKYKLNMLLIAKEGSQGFLKASLKLKQFQIMELSLVVDECLEFVADVNFIKEKSRLKNMHQSQQIDSRLNYQIDARISQEIVSPPRQEKDYEKDHFVSLGIESVSQSDDIDLLCDEDITFNLPVPKVNVSEDLQKITERAQEFESDSSSSRRLNRVLDNYYQYPI